MSKRISVEFTAYGQDYSEKVVLGVAHKRGSRQTLKIVSDDPQVIAAITDAAIKSMNGSSGSSNFIHESKSLPSLPPHPASSFCRTIS